MTFKGSNQNIERRFGKTGLRFNSFWSSLFVHKFGSRLHQFYFLCMYILSENTKTKMKFGTHGQTFYNIIFMIFILIFVYCFDYVCLFVMRADVRPSHDGSI